MCVHVCEPGVRFIQFLHLIQDVQKVEIHINMERPGRVLMDATSGEDSNDF